MVLREAKNGAPVLTVEAPADLEALEKAVSADYPDTDSLVGHLVMSSLIELDEDRPTVLPFELIAVDAVHALCAIGRHQDLLDKVEIIDLAA